MSSGKINKYEHLTGEEILPSDQSRIIEQAKFTCSPLGKGFEKQIKPIEEQRKKQVEGFEKQIKLIEEQRNRNFKAWYPKINY